MKLNHIGIAVRDIEVATTIFEEILGQSFSEAEVVDSQKVKVKYAGVIELIQAIQDHSPLYSMMRHPVLNFIEKKGEGLHHLCFEVDDLDVFIARLAERGVFALTKDPQEGSGNSRVIFLNPKFCNGLLIELKEV